MDLFTFLKQVRLSSKFANTKPSKELAPKTSDIKIYSISTGLRNTFNHRNRD